MNAADRLIERFAERHAGQSRFHLSGAQARWLAGVWRNRVVGAHRMRGQSRGVWSGTLGDGRAWYAATDRDVIGSEAGATVYLALLAETARLRHDADHAYALSRYHPSGSEAASLARARALYAEARRLEDEAV